MHLHNKIDTKLFLWGLFFIQLFLIGLFISFGSSSFNNISTPTNDPEQNFNVKFIDTIVNEADYGVDDYLHQKRNGKRRNNHKKIVIHENELQLEPVGNYSKQFLVMTQKDHQNNTKEIVCFREGTAVQDTKLLLSSRGQNDGGDGEIVHCKCLPEWHGKDCGQPEVLWRAFMTSKVPLNLKSVARKRPHKIFYIIHQATSISLETIEIQVMELIDVVDLFIFCDILISSSSSSLPSFSEDAISRQHNKSSSTGFLRLFPNRFLMIFDKTCSGKNIYRKMKVRLQKQIKPENNLENDDIIVISKSDEILNRKAINYFKWYDNWPQPVRFRFKYNVYGFFWQHPESTILGSAACQLGVLGESYKDDPERIMITKKPGMIVGDLNHYGGWFCQYCYQPIDIVKRLEYEFKIDKYSFDAIFHIDSNKQIIDSNYIQNLIAKGLYVDSKMGLIKIHRYSDKYYSPDYVTQNSWKFDNIVINLFARWEEDDDEYF